MKIERGGWPRWGRPGVVFRLLRFGTAVPGRPWPLLLGRPKPLGRGVLLQVGHRVLMLGACAALRGAGFYYYFGIKPSSKNTP